MTGPRLIYIGNIRLPTEKAHGLQIVQNCEAFADNGADVSLWAAARQNTPELHNVTDVWAHYGVKQNFRLRRLPTIDLLVLASGQDTSLSRFIFRLQALTFALSMVIGALFTPADIYYSRDALIIALLSFIKPAHRLGYEAHSKAKGRAGLRLQQRAIRHASVFATTGKLREELIAMGANPARAYVAHDGVRLDRFANLPARSEARAAFGWPENAFIVGYVGRLHTMSMDKGVGLLVDSLATVPGAALALVGGPDDQAEALRARWLGHGLPGDRFLYAGQVHPDRVAVALAALDVAAMPFPWTEHFAFYASPIKLFEYMAAGCAIVASDLPSTAEVVRSGETALLVPPSDGEALAEAIIRLKAELALRQSLGEAARALVLAEYTWDGRAQHILGAIAGFRHAR
ncbi:MAG: glycosyltransferase family 4 protein [Anaerolineae bacterium]